MDPNECVNYEWIVEYSLSLDQNLNGFSVAETFPIGPIRSEGVKAIDN